MDLLEKLALNKTMPSELKELIKYLEERAKFSLFYNKKTCGDIAEYIFKFWKTKLAEKEDSRVNELTEWFRELTGEYRIRDIYAGYYDENIEDIFYRLEGVKMLAPFGKNVLVLARMECQRCKKHFFAILPFSFDSHYFEEPITYKGYDSPLLEFPLTAMGYLEASRAFVDLLRGQFIAKSYSVGKSLLTTFKTKKDLERLKQTGQYSQVFLAREFPLDLEEEFDKEYWGLRLNRGSDLPPHSTFELPEKPELSEKTDKKGKVNQNE